MVSRQLSGRTKTITWLGFLSYLAVFLYLLSPNRYETPAYLLSAVVFLIIQIIAPNYRFRKDIIICPQNISLTFFFVQLVCVPLLAAFWGTAIHVLPFLPSSKYMNFAILINTAAFASFALSYQWSWDRQRSSYEKSGRPQNKSPNEKSLELLQKLRWPFFFVGIVGFVLFFGSYSGYIAYVSTPETRIVLQESLAGSVRGASTTFLRPFLAASLVIFYSTYVLRRQSLAANLRLRLAGFATVLLLVVANTHYNRGTIIGPILAFAAAYSLLRERIRLHTLLLGGSLILLLAIMWGEYRLSDLVLNELFTQRGLETSLDDFRLLDFIQIYAAGPQFSGFLLEQTIGRGWTYELGSTLVSSLLYPVPILGEAFRETSGVTIYNLLIYEGRSHIDQVIPFQGELFLNFHLLGVVAAFSLLGFISERLQRWFERAGNFFEAYYLMLTSIWILFLILGSLAVTSQILVFFLWPFYIYLALKFLLRNRPRP